VQAVEDELGETGLQRREAIALRNLRLEFPSEPRKVVFELPDAGDLGQKLVGREAVASPNRAAVFDRLIEIAECLGFQVLVEHVLDRLIDNAVDDAVFFARFLGHREFHLAA